MKKTVLKKHALEKIKAIHELSLSYNKKLKKDHKKKILSLMRKHVNEIEDLLNKKDKHGLIETGDLLILCFELLLEYKFSIDKVLIKCFRRYEDKLNILMKGIQ